MSRCAHCEYKICPGRDCIEVKCPMYDENLPDTTCRCIANNYDAYEDCPYFKEATNEI